MNEKEKSVVLALSGELPTKNQSDYILVGDPWYVKTASGKDYEFAEIISPKGASEIWMFMNERFTEYRSYDVPIKEIYSGEITDFRANELLDILTCQLIYDTVVLYEGVSNKYISDDVTIDSSEQVDGESIASVLGIGFQKK